MKDKKLIAAVSILIIFHVVGFYGLAFSQNPASFRTLSPLNLILTSVILFSFHKTWNWSFFFFAVTTLVVGFVSEVIGVHTGLLYGDYTYGQSLGVKVWDIPVVIAINWLMLVYITGTLCNSLKINWMLKAMVAAGLMVFLDIFIEPVAAVLDFWTWESYRIPASNYYGWLGVGFLLQLYFQKANFQKQNRVAPYVFDLQLLFFIGLNLVL